MTKKDLIIIIAIAFCFSIIGFSVAKMFNKPVVKDPIDFNVVYKKHDDSLITAIQARDAKLNLLLNKISADSIATQKRYHEIFNFTPTSRNRWRDSVKIANRLR